MKRGTIEHPKTEALAGRLQIPLAQAVGHLEALFHYSAKYAPRGDIGRWTDEIIARRCLWEGDPVRFIQALVSAGYLDLHARCRLLVHDWSEHADDAVRKNLKRRGETFADGQPPYSGQSRDKVENPAGLFPEPVATESRQNPDIVASKERPCPDFGATVDRQRPDNGATMARQRPDSVPTQSCLPEPCQSLALPEPEPPGEREYGPDPEGAEAEPPPARPLETRSGLTPVGKALQPSGIPPANGALTHTRDAVGRYFPSPDDGILAQILGAARAVDPEISDQECGIWVHAVVPDGGFRRAKGPAWWTTTIPEELAKRPRDVRLVRAFVQGEIPASEASTIIHDAKADWRLLKALRVWLAQQLAFEPAIEQDELELQTSA